MRTALYKLSRSFTSTEEDPSTSSSSTALDTKKPQLQTVKTTTDIPDDFTLPIHLLGYNPNTRNRLLTEADAHLIQNWVPPRIQLYVDWTLIYSLEQHGSSLHSLYGNLRSNVVPPHRRVGYLLIIRDSRGGLFGGYCNEPWLPNEHRRYGGNGECFLFRLTDNKEKEERLEVFNHTGLNEFDMYCTSKFLSMGAGEGHYGLWVDDGLLKGVTYNTPTYNNEVLSKEGEKFHITGLEIWRIGS